MRRSRRRFTAPERVSEAKTPAATDAATYKFWTTEHIRFADLDVLGHVNNIAFTVYAESGRAAFLRETGLWTPQGDRLNVLARIELDYRRELHYPGEVRVGLRVIKLGRSSYTMGIGIFDSDQCAATAQAVLVRIDRVSRKAIELNAEERSALAPYV